MKVVSTTNAPAAIGPYSQALDLGNMVFVSGQIPVDPATGTMADTVEQQAAQSLANLKAILAEAGLSMNNVVKTVIFLADINDFAAVNAEYAKAFADARSPPAAACRWQPSPRAQNWRSSASPCGTERKIRQEKRDTGASADALVSRFLITFKTGAFTSAHRPRIAR